MTAITRQSARLAADERKKLNGGSWTHPSQPTRKLDAEFSAWRKSHPTPAERLRAAKDGRERARMDVEYSARLYRQFYGLE